MVPKIPPKKVDDIKNMKEMMELCELLNVVYDQENPNLKEMKKEAKKMIEEQSLNGTTVSVLYSNIIIIYLPNYLTTYCAHMTLYLIFCFEAIPGEIR